MCPLEDAKAFLRTLDLELYFDHAHDRCYCPKCYKGPKTIANEEVQKELK